jgi:hypothetical protein
VVREFAVRLFAVHEAAPDAKDIAGSLAASPGMLQYNA